MSVKLIQLHLLSIIFCLAGCHPSEKQVIPAFYHWQTRFQLTETELLYLNELKVKDLYVKYFDLDWDYSRNSAIPLAILEKDTSNLLSYRIHPTIFITNRTFLETSIQDLDTLAVKTLDLIRNINNGSLPNEIQFDCDWTPKTQQKFFGYLRAVRQHLDDGNIHLSATIRLHQLKYFEKTGVPPVDNGTLMVYNVGDIESWQESNSILTAENVEKYLIPFKSYPLELNIALPVFKWGLVFRGNKLIKIINELDEVDLRNLSGITKLTENRYQLKKSLYIKGHYLYEGDKIRLEKAEVESLKNVVRLLNDHIYSKAFTVLFYHLDTTTIKYYPHEQLHEILKIF